MIWYYNFVLKINKHLKYLVGKASQQLYSWEYDRYDVELHAAQADEKKQFWSVHMVKEIAAQFSAPSHTTETETHCSESSWPYFITISGEKLLDEIKCSNKFPLFCFGLFLCAGCQTVSGSKRRMCLWAVFLSLSGLDWGTRLTRGCTHLPQTGVMTLVVAGGCSSVITHDFEWKKTVPLPRSILLPLVWVDSPAICWEVKQFSKWWTSGQFKRI